jgi:hypothetical protein
VTEPEQAERDYQTYRCLLDLWSRENPIKTTKLQVLLAVNALLVATVTLSGGIVGSHWYIYFAGAVFSAIWMFSIGRTALFQDVWQIKLADLRQRHPQDPRFSILETADAQRRARPLIRTFGAVPSKWYLLPSPLVFALAWLLILVISIA